MEVLGAGRAAVEMGPHAGDLAIGPLAAEGQLHVAVELGEALLAAQLRPVESEHSRQRLGGPSTGL
jgi:hypothetical protein